ncbi:hypothetical protein AC249_AIPGENE28104 [Exaiptasia diaphana]|nr:hypothetical protein AC249_AIPGENE28104 [Exaiptasia diaphana]
MLTLAVKTLGSRLGSTKNSCEPASKRDSGGGDPLRSEPTLEAITEGAITSNACSRKCYASRSFYKIT